MIYSIKFCIGYQKYFFSSLIKPIVGDAGHVSLLCHLAFTSNFCNKSCCLDERYRSMVGLRNSAVWRTGERNTVSNVFLKERALYNTFHFWCPDSTRGHREQFLTFGHDNSTRISQTKRLHICEWAASHKLCSSPIWYIDVSPTSQVTALSDSRIRFKFHAKLWNLKSNILQELKKKKVKIFVPINDKHGVFNWKHLQ